MYRLQICKDIIYGRCDICARFYKNLTIIVLEILVMEKSIFYVSLCATRTCYYFLIYEIFVSIKLKNIIC